MILTVIERLILLGILPKEGNITDNKLIQNVINDVGFTDAEKTQLKFEDLPGGLTKWDTEAAMDCRREFEIGPGIYSIIKAQLEKLNSQNTLPRDAISLWDKFMEETELSVTEKKKSGPEIVEGIQKRASPPPLPGMIE